MSRLYIIATPIGNLEDVSLRSLRILSEIEVLACEDTRVTRKLLSRHEIPYPRTCFSCHEHNEERVLNRIIGFLNGGVDVALCSDGGYPSISDPGYRVVSEAIKTGHDIDVIPGASAVPVALVASGLPTSSYIFKGFPPRKTGARCRFLEQDKDLEHTLIIFESPYRVGKLLADAYKVLGDRKAAVCLELTKKFESVHRDYLSDLATEFAERKVKGEVVVVIASANPKFTRSSE